MRMEPLAPEFLEILVCPVSHKPLKQVGVWLVSTDAETRLRYPILEDGIPVMLAEEAETLSEDDWKAALA